MPKKIIVGIVAEDDSDVSVIIELLRRSTPRKNFSWERFIGDGCAKIRIKLESWSNVLRIKGCTCLVVVHDLDRNSHPQLHAELSAKTLKCGIKAQLILIPIEELEAWLLSDMNAIRSVFKLQKIAKEIPNPQTIESPKEHLRDIVSKWSGNEKDYLNTKHNKKIAEEMDLAKLYKKCSTFRPLQDFAALHL